MSIYTFKNTEINNKKATEFETKSLLYLFGFVKGSDEVDLFTIDCFNDVTGIDENYKKLWDVQSKNHASFYPKKIGESISTLYKNYISGLSFCSLILFMPCIKSEYLINDKLDEFRINNFKEVTKQRIINGFIKKAQKDFGENDDIKVESFLEKLLFVQDNIKISEYIERIIKFKDIKNRDEDFYLTIFEEIRDVQSVKKNTYIENEEIEKLEDVLKYNRHLFKKEINVLIINRIVGCDIFEQRAIPVYFKNETDGLDIEATKDLINDCRINLSRSFFDKNYNPEFWKVLEFIINELDDDPQANIYQVYKELKGAVNIRSVYLNYHSLLFMISIIKEKIYEN